METIDTNKKLTEIIKFSIAMAQELQEIIGEPGYTRPFLATQNLLDEWEIYFKENELLKDI